MARDLAPQASAIRVYLGVCSARLVAILWQNRHDRGMTHRFPRFALAALASGIGLLVMPAMHAKGQATGDRRQPAASVATSAGQLPTPNSPLASSGQRLCSGAARRIANEPAISAELRYRIDAFGHELIGTGNYLQSAL